MTQSLVLIIRVSGYKTRGWIIQSRLGSTTNPRDGTFSSDFPSLENLQKMQVKFIAICARHLSSLFSFKLWAMYTEFSTSAINLLPKFLTFSAISQ